MTAVYKRELRSYFTSMVGYVVMAVLIFFVGIYFMAYNIFSGYTQFSYTLLSSTLIFMVAIPILTMRSMAEERRSRTDQLLLTAPVSVWRVVAGKYLAMVTVLAMAVAVCSFCPLIIALNGTAHLGVDYASILAFFLMGCVFIAVGMFISALTESQIIAAVGTFAVLLVLYLWSDLVTYLPDTLEELLSAFDFQGVLNNFAYYSVFDVGGLVMYLSLAAAFVFLTVQVTKRRRGESVAPVTAAALAVILVANLVVGQLPSNLQELDISDQGIYTVSDTSVDYLSALEEDVELVVLAEDANIDPMLSKFLYNYAALSSRVTLTFVDPVAHPSALETYDAQANTVVVRCEATGKQRAVAFDDMLVLDYMSYYYYGTTSYTEFDAEGQLTSAVDYVTRDTTEVVYLMEGHGESSLGATVTDAMEKANLTTQTVTLLLEGSVPEDCALLLCNQPTRDLTEDERTLLEEYLAAGGQMMLILPQSGEDMPQWETLLNTYGLATDEGYVTDLGKYYGQWGYYYFCATLSTSSDITGEFDSDALTMLYAARGMTQVEAARDTITVDPFMSTSSTGYNDAQEAQGEWILGASCTEETDGGTARLTVIGAATLLDEDFLSVYGSAFVNLDLFMNALTVGMEDVSQIAIESISLTSTYNTFTNAGAWSALYLAVLPLLILGGGLVYWIKRRKR